MRGTAGFMAPEIVTKGSLATYEGP